MPDPERTMSELIGRRLLVLNRAILAVAALLACACGGAVLAGEAPSALGDGRPVDSGARVDSPVPAAKALGAPTEATRGTAADVDVHVDNGVGVAARSQGKGSALAPAFVRVEEDDSGWVLTGAWTATSLARSSGGSVLRASAAGVTAEHAFEGTWLVLGFVGDRFAGEVQISIDGVDQGSFDLYRREEQPLQLAFQGLAAGAHLVRITAAASSNPLSQGVRTQLDYADYGDGTPLAAGSVEEDSPQLMLSSGWTSVAYAGASAGSYIRASSAAAWMPFSGDSFSLHALAYSAAGRAQLFVDGIYLDTIDLYAPVFFSEAEPRTFAYQGLGAGEHVLQILSYEDAVTLDRIDTPGSAPFIDPNAPEAGIARIESDDPRVGFNGLPLALAATSWTRVNGFAMTRASGGEAVSSQTAEDTVTLAFEGEWLGVGFATDSSSGQAEIAINGVVVDTVDLYTRFDDTLSRYYRDLGPGPHSLSIRVLGTAHPNASASHVRIDFFDLWDGQPLADGSFEEDHPRVRYGRGWGKLNDPAASGGRAFTGGPSASAWFAFSGDSVTWQGWSRFNYQQVELRIDGQSQGLFDVYSEIAGPVDYSFTGLGSGPHVLEVRTYRGDTASVDVLSTPALGAPRSAPSTAAVARFEEDHPAMRYNGWPYRQMARSWSEQGAIANSSKYNLRSTTASDRWSLEFSGEWINLGFRSEATSGEVEVLIDGQSRGVFSTAGGVNGSRNLIFADLGSGSHTVEVVVVSGDVRPDFIDVWDGASGATGWVNVSLIDDPGDGLTLSDRRWWTSAEEIYAREGDLVAPFVNTTTNTWLSFVGESLTVLPFQRSGTSLQVVIDGVDRGTFDLSPEAPFRTQPKALHFPDLGPGAHVVQVATPAVSINAARLDAFEIAPADFADYTPSVEWFDTRATETLPGGSNTGFASTIAIGDLDGDGSVELVAPSLNGRLYVYRGDGQDAGDGTPLLWTSDLVGPAAEPALADLDGDGDAEIVVVGKQGTFAFHHDGQLAWSNTAVISHNSSEDFGWGGPSIGNLDLDAEPEIVISASGDALYVLDHQGNILYSDPLMSDTPTVPVLADLTGDGVLDIVVASEWTLKVIDFFSGGGLAWSRELPDPIVVLGGAGAFGAPAIADLDGDGRAEVIINWGHVVEALQDDGSLLWRYPTGRNDLFKPSAVTIADVTGDGKPNVITASARSGGLFISHHQMMVLDEAGDLVWQQEVGDNTASASGVVAQDLTGNGVWEILWNGSVDGLLIFNGPDGKRLYNEPLTRSGTVMDYPTLADVDGDGQAEVVLAGSAGLFVFGHSGRWVDSRPQWNQHNYHINNVESDWRIPFTEANSWEVHNTYRTQTPDRDPGCLLQDGNPLLPQLVDLSPAAGEVLSSGVPLVLSARALQVGPFQPILDVLVNGESVQSLDPSGSVFHPLTLVPGSNRFDLVVVDRCGQFTSSIELSGAGDAQDPWSDVADASVLFEARFSQSTHDPGTDRLLAKLQVFNDGPTVNGPVLMAMGRDADPAVSLLNADGVTPQGEPYVIVVEEGDALAPGALSAARDVVLRNPQQAPIDFTPRWLAPLNQNPYFLSIPIARATTGQPWRYRIETADGNGDALALSLTTAPAGMTLVDGELQWTPSAPGSADVVVAVSDGRGGTARQGFTLTVSDGSFNRPPVFITTPPARIAIGGDYRYAAAASDIDNDPLSFQLQSAPVGVTVDAGSGLVSWNTAAPGRHSIVLRVDDGRGGQATQSWTLYVGETEVTPPGPAFSSVPETVAAVGVQYRYAYRVASSAGAASVSLAQAPARMSLDTGRGTLTWVPGGPDLGVHEVELLAVDDNGTEARQRFDLSVLAALPNQPPYFTSVAPGGARVGSLYRYAAAAVDPEFTALSWSLDAAPAGMSVDPDTGLVEWTPAAALPSTVSVALRAVDAGGATATQGFDIAVRESNAAPVISTAPPTSVLAGAFYSVRMRAEDADGDPLHWRLLQGPPGMTLHPGFGWLHWTTLGNDPGSYLVRLEVSDDWGGRDELGFSISLLADSEPPTLSIRMQPDTACRLQAAEVCVETADNVGLSSVGLSLDGAPVALDSARCHRFTPADAGLLSAVATALDPSGLSGSSSRTLSVADCNDTQAPVVTLVAPTLGLAFDQPTPIVVNIEDNTPEILTWEVTLRGLASGETQTLASGSGAVSGGQVAVFDPTLLPSGDYEIEVVASDGAQTGGLRLPMAAGTGSKPGRVAFTTVDLNWNVGGFPLNVGRSYDSLDAGPLGGGAGDFGPGWRLALSASIEDSAPDLPADAPTFSRLAAEPYTTQTRVTVVKPNGERVGFRFAPEAKSWPSVLQFAVRFEPDPGVTDTLRAVGWPDTVFQLGNGFADFLLPYNPDLFELTTPEGVVYRISESAGLLEVRDVEGGVLSLTESGWQSSRGARVDYLRDGQGRITDVVLIDDDGSSELGRIRYGYDLAGNLVSVTDLAGGVSRFEYDNAGYPHHLTAMFDAAGRAIARMVFDEDGRMIAHCPGDADLATLQGCSQFDFDGAVSTQTQIDGLGLRSELSYDERGLLVLRRDEVSPNSFAEQRWVYDAQGREVEYIDADGGISRSEWDDEGNRIRLTEPDGRYWVWEYGACHGDDSWLRQCDALGNCVEQRFDEACRLTSSTDPLGGVSTRQYNAQGQRTLTIDALSQVLQSQFNNGGKLERVTDALGGVSLFEYGEFGELRAETQRDGLRREFLYDEGVRVSEERWLGGSPSESGISWSHDAGNLIDGLSWSGAEVDLSYWPDGRIRRITHSSPSAPDWWIEYAYDGNNNVVRLEDSFGGLTEYAYDGLNRVTEARQSGAGVSSKRVVIEYSASGQPIAYRRYASLDDSQPGPVTLFEYACLSCPTSLSRIAHQRADGSPIHELSYSRNALHEIDTLTDADGSHAFVRDGRGWLVAADYANGFATANQSFQWDAAGNWLSRSGSFGGANTALLGYQQGQGGHRLLSDGVNTYQYDARGALVLKTGPDGRLEIARDRRGNAVQVSQFDAAGQPVSQASYTFGSNQQRVRAERDGVVRHYVFDGPNPIIALDDSGQVVWRALQLPTFDRTLAMDSTAGLRWLLSDHLGSVRNQVDNAGQVLAAFSYDAFGRQVSGPAPGIDDPFRFAGREFDVPGDLGYYRLRLYDPAIGRFLSEDILEPFHYAYANNNPINLADPTGAVAVFEYALLLCKVAGQIAEADGPASLVRAAFSGSIAAFKYAVADFWIGQAVDIPCGIPLPSVGGANGGDGPGLGGGVL